MNDVVEEGLLMDRGMQKSGSRWSIWSSGFQGLLWTNFFTAVNDNAFRWFVIGVGKDFWEVRNHPQILMWGTVCFVLPYLMFAVVAGWLADKFSKRNVILVCKFAEIVIMLLGIGALLLQNFELLLVAVFFMGAQSALFSPAKVGMIPELLDEGEISKGNGLFNLATLSAVIIGMGIGSGLSDWTGNRGQERIWLSALVLVGIAVVGTATGFLMRRVPAANPHLRFPVNQFAATYRQFLPLFATSRLWRVALGVAFFWTFASLGQLNVDAFADENGMLFELEKIPLLISLVLGVGAGSVLAGFLSAGRIELGLVPVGAAGMVGFAIAIFWLLPEYFLVPPGTWWGIPLACLLFALLGISAGFFDVPLSSWLQFNSPLKSRGSILAATNFLLFASIVASTLVYTEILRRPFWSPANDSARPAIYATGNLAAGLNEKIDKRMVEYRKNPPADPDQFVSRSDSLIQRPLVTRIVEDRLAMQGAERQREIQLALNQKVDPPGSGPVSFIFSENDNLRQEKVIRRLAGPRPLASAGLVFFLLGAATIPVLAYVVWRLGRDLVRVVLWNWLKIVYRIRIHGHHHIPEQGAAILIANHTTWLDAMLLMLLPRRDSRPIAWAGNFNGFFLNCFAKFAQVILISGGPKSIAKGLKVARQALEDGQLVIIFPEGGLSRTGNIQGFKAGILKITEKSDAPIIPIYLDQLWGSFFSYKGGKPFRRIPLTFRRPISIHVGPPLKREMGLFQMRQELMKMGANAVAKRAGRFESPVAMFLKSCKQRLFSWKIDDSTGQRLTGGALLMRVLILRRLMRKHVLSDTEKNVAVLIPPSSGGVVVNLALAVDRRVAVNLNYSVSPEIMKHCIQEAGIQHVLTTGKVLEKFDYKFDCKVELLDTLRGKVTLWDKLISAVMAYAIPVWIIKWMIGGVCADRDELLTIIFTSGSTGMPKGVMLSHGNIASNVEAIDQVISLKKHDVFIGVLPFFHSFGYTVSLWTVASLDIGGGYHFSPLDAKQIGKLVQSCKGTVLLATPTFLRNYTKRCSPEEFASLEVVVVGAEKMPLELADEFEKKYGIRPIEGYGTTELSPLVSVNIPPTRRLDNFQVDCREGTVGRPIPNVVAEVRDLETDEVLGADQSGMLYIAGPNVMLGYLNHPEQTAAVIVDGWYRTGDVALIDPEGFIRITGRMSRFSKIGGEMVPHVSIEETMLAALGNTDELPVLAVTAVPDPRKGERIIVLHTSRLTRTPEELCKALTDSGMPNLFIPSRDSFIQVEAIPVLGTGKIDLKGLKETALRLTTG